MCGCGCAVGVGAGGQRGGGGEHSYASRELDLCTQVQRRRAARHAGGRSLAACRETSSLLY